LGRALGKIGFAYIGGHGVPQDVIDGAFTASRAFHASPDELKRALAINEYHRGFMWLASSTVVTSSVARVTRPNLSESLMVMHEAAAGEIGQPLQGPNRWPDWLPGFRAAIDAYRIELERVSRAVIRLIAVALDLPADALDRHFARPTTFLRLLRYPPHPAEAGDDQFGSAPHTDYGIITLLAQDDSGGLQVRRRDGGWIDAAPLPGTFVLNVADMLARWTNDRFVSTPHRVVNRSGGDRYSLPFFFDTDMDAVIECLPTCTGPGNLPRYEPVRYGDYLMDRLNRNYDYRKGEAAE
jgi:isopenicillin N synthase-like dioxygenase